MLSRDCEVSFAPNACVIEEGRPCFIGVSEILIRSTGQAKELLKQELEIRLEELESAWHASSLERLFIENKLYRLIEDCESWEEVLEVLAKAISPFSKQLKRKISAEDVAALTEIKIKRISKYDVERANKVLKELEESIEKTNKQLNQLTRFCINYLKKLKESFGEEKGRRCELTTFEKVDRSQVAIANETFYVDHQQGFAGWGIKKGEAIGACSRLDDAIVISSQGVLRISKMSEKFDVGSRPAYINVFQKKQPLVFSMLYREGKSGPVLAKRFKVGGVTRDRDYELTKGKVGNRVFYLVAHAAEEESEKHRVKIHLKADLNLQKLSQNFCFGDVGIKNRSVRGKIIERQAISKVTREA